MRVTLSRTTSLSFEAKISAPLARMWGSKKIHIISVRKTFHVSSCIFAFKSEVENNAFLLLKLRMEPMTCHTKTGAPNEIRAPKVSTALILS